MTSGTDGTDPCTCVAYRRQSPLCGDMVSAAKRTACHTRPYQPCRHNKYHISVVTVVAPCALRLGLRKSVPKQDMCSSGQNDKASVLLFCLNSSSRQGAAGQSMAPSGAAVRAGRRHVAGSCQQSTVPRSQPSMNRVIRVSVAQTAKTGSAKTISQPIRCRRVPERRVNYRHHLCCTTETVAVRVHLGYGKYPKFFATAAKEAKRTYVPC
jgi:hypothetical protein